VVSFDSEQEAFAMVERLKECDIAPERIRVYEWVDVMTDGNFEPLAYKSRFAVTVVGSRMLVN